MSGWVCYVVWWAGVVVVGVFSPPLLLSLLPYSVATCYLVTPPPPPLVTTF